MTVAADAESFGSRCELHFWPLMAAKMCCQRFCDSIEAVGVLCQLPNSSVSGDATAILARCLYQGNMEDNASFEKTFA